MAHTTASDVQAAPKTTLAPTSQQNLHKFKTFFRRSALAKLQGCRWNKLWALSLGVLILALTGLLTVTLVYALARAVPFDYGIVFDAGSTHTEMLLYTWESKEWYETGYVRQLSSCYLDGGIGELFVDDPSGVQNYLLPCLSNGTEQIPADKHWNSPVYLAATAGLRMLQIDKGVAVNEILGNVSELFNMSGLKNRENNVKIITGQQEGVSSWVGVNYLADSFQKSVTTLGALDLGGASTQITFEVGTDVEVGRDKVTLRLYGKEYNVTADSYLCHGVNQLILRHEVSLLETAEAAESVTVENPCRAVGMTLERSISDMRNPCTETIFLQNFQNVTFQGTGNADLCAEQLRKVISVEYCKATFVNTGNCMEDLPPARPNGKEFLAFSTFFYIASGFNATENLGSAEFLAKVNEVCGLTEEALNSTYFPETGEKYKKDMCYEGLYMFLLLKEQYSFTEEEWVNTRYADKINGTSVGWALGFMIENTNVIPMQRPLPLLPVAWFVILSLLFLAMIGLSMWLAISALKFNGAGGNFNQTQPMSTATTTTTTTPKTKNRKEKF
ncbi:ectonucleoside triphosphate diphosphohydrolase 1-like isoform X2 [Neocloeon triangulifer]|uniref:ectonucleoside triphosphate diphosphohydrolase 1-like isoform X2 n=1 Tax=Neocloeon triangulifer TaxID=2078957 RepID=UPI00286F2B12|nr:ectonucleoside triphosphate diphosphohydrolase 1-like isoform X2 [Neocloeon triangulifer]